jgi:hypothetical protein
VGLAAFSLGGCVASVREERLVGPPRATIESRSEVTTETRAGGSTVAATVTGGRVDVAVRAVALCREVRVTAPMVRDVEIVRAFADDAQERNVVMAFLIGAGVGVLAYAANQAACPPSASGCSVGAATAGEYALAGLASIPLGFAAYNAARVQDGRAVERAASQRESGTWSSCATRPLGGEAVDVTLAGSVWRGITGPDGHVVLDVSPQIAARDAPADAGARTALVHHEGSPDITIDLTAASRPAL